MIRADRRLLRSLGDFGRLPRGKENQSVYSPPVLSTFEWIDVNRMDGLLIVICVSCVDVPGLYV